MRILHIIVLRKTHSKWKCQGMCTKHRYCAKNMAKARLEIIKLRWILYPVENRTRACWRVCGTQADWQNRLAKEQRQLRYQNSVRGFDSEWTLSQTADSKKQLLAHCMEEKKENPEGERKLPLNREESPQRAKTIYELTSKKRPKAKKAELLPLH